MYFQKTQCKYNLQMMISDARHERKQHFNGAKLWRRDSMHMEKQKIETAEQLASESRLENKSFLYSLLIS